MKNPIKNTTLITRKQFNDTLKNRFGLTIDKDSICKYIDDFNCNLHIYNEINPKIFTTTFVDRFGFSWSNTYGEFYKLHTKENTKLFKEFKEFKSSYTFKIDNHFYI